jgi:mycothione reductase
MDECSYDVIVIGSGGGTKLVRPVAAKGMRVALIEREKLGGTCLNRGCIPSKMLIHPADVATAIRESGKYDLRVTGDIMVNFSKLVARVNQTVDAESDSIAPVYDNDPNVDYIPGHATFVDKKTIEVNGKRLSAERFFITTGADAYVPDIPGLADTPYMTYREALRSTKKPKSLIVLGGGYIAMELGYFYAALGVETHFFVRSRMLKGEDHEVQEEFEKLFSAKHNVYFGRTIAKVEYSFGTFKVTDNNGEVLEAEGLLMASGIRPMTDQLGLENTDVQLDNKGFIKVDDHLRTHADGIWAFGDCIGRHLFRHAANYEGEYLFRSLYENPVDEAIQYNAVPHAVFSNPQIGGVGKRERDLQNEGVDYVVGTCPYKKCGMGMALIPDGGFVKLLFDRNTRSLLGAHIIGEEASNMIHMPIAYMNMGATIDDMLKTIYVHPALPELVRNAARNALPKFAKPPEST